VQLFYFRSSDTKVTKDSLYVQYSPDALHNQVTSHQIVSHIILCFGKEDSVYIF